MTAPVLVLVVATLAALLVISGVAKLFTPDRTCRALTALRLPRAFATTGFAIAWAVLEIMIGVGLVLLPRPAATLAAVTATALAVVFLAVVVRASRFDEPVHCHCFGALDTEPVGPSTIVRNSGLLAIAALSTFGLITTSGADGDTAASSVLTTAARLDGAEQSVFQVGLLLAGGLAVLQVMRAFAARSTTAVAATPGQQSLGPAPSSLGPHQLPDIFGASHDVRGFVGDRRSVLVFLSTSCAACAALAEQLPDWRVHLAEGGVQVRAITAQPPSQALSSFPLLGSFLHQDANDALAAELGITTLPAAVYVGRDGTPTVVDGPALGPHAISVLIDNIRSVEVVPT